MSHILKILIVSFLFVSCGRVNETAYDKYIRQFRQEYVQGFLEEERSPLGKEDLQHLSFFIPDSMYRVEAEYTLLPDSEPFELKTSSNKRKSYRKFARLSFELLGEDLTLYVYESMKLKDEKEYENYLFLPFTDTSNGEDSYGGGRYMDLDRRDFEGGKVEIDFNKNYNPWCVYSAGYNCPVPPRENDLPVRIAAGERIFLGEYKE